MKSLLLILALFTTGASANTGTRGGGDAIVCYQGPQIASVELLDYFEMNQMGLTLDLGPQSLPYQEKLKLVLSRWSQFDPVMTDYFTKHLLEFEKNAAFLDRSYLQDIDDSDEIISPKKNCRLKQMAISRLEDLAPGEKRFLIDKELWQRLNSDQKTGLVIHEVFWSFFRKYNEKQKSSSYIRRFNGILSSSAFSSYTAEDYIMMIQNLWGNIEPDGYIWCRPKAHSPSIKFEGLIYSINMCMRFENGKIKRAFMPRPSPFRIGGKDFYFSGFSLLTSNVVEFYPSGSVKEGRLYKSILLNLAENVTLELPALFSYLKFSEDGSVLEVKASRAVDGIFYYGYESYTDIQVRPSLKWNHVDFPIEEVKFDKAGRVRFLSMQIWGNENFSFRWKNKTYRLKGFEPLVREASIEFDENGKITRSFHFSVEK